MTAAVTPSRKHTIRVSLPTLELEVSSSGLVFSDERALKEWVLTQHRETLLASLSVKYGYNTGIDHEVTPEVEPVQNLSENASAKSSCKRKSVLDSPDPGKSLLSSRAHMDHPAESFSHGSVDETGEPLNNNRRRDLLDCIASVQRQFFQSERPNVVFGLLLETLLELTESEYGFIGEIKYEDDGTMFLHAHAFTNIAWNQATLKVYEDNRETGLKFYNLKSLFGTVMTTGEPLIANDPAIHPKRTGIPEGHPPLRHFLGIPFFKTGGEINGMVGISNKPGGYSAADIDLLEPLTVTCSNLIQAYVQKNDNQWLINNLENSVRVRTQELELANVNLEEANRKVKHAALMQLQHFGMCTELSQFRGS